VLGLAILDHRAEEILRRNPSLKRESSR